MEYKETLYLALIVLVRKRYMCLIAEKNDRGSEAKTMGNEEVDAIINVLKNFGYSVRKDSILIGDSGIRHKFDIIAEREGITLLFNFTEDDRVKYDYLGMIGKYMDLKNVGTRFFLMVNINKGLESEELCNNIDLVPYTSIDDLVIKMRKILREIELS